MMNVDRRTVLATLGLMAIGSQGGCLSDRTATGTDSEPTTLTPPPRAPSWSTSPTQAAKLITDDGHADDEFGGEIALSSDGTRALVAAPHDDTAGDASGAVYVFAKTAEEWVQQAKLIPDDGDSKDVFGSSVELLDGGTTALIGAQADEAGNQHATGSVYVFSKREGAWQQEAKLTADDGDGLDFFGSAVRGSRNGATALIAASGDEDPNGDYSGAVYEFSRTNGSWRQQTKVTPDDGTSLDSFGGSIGLSWDATTALFGASISNDIAGAVYVFEQSNGAWKQQTKLVPDDGDEKDMFGFSVDLAWDGTTALVAAPHDEDPNGEDAGSAYVFAQTNGTWNQQTKLTPDDGDEGDSFGEVVALSADGTTAFVGANEDEDPNGDSSGSTYVFSQRDGSWRQQAKLTPRAGNSEAEFGSSVAVSVAGTTTIIGATGANTVTGDLQGAAYVFEESE